MYMHDIMIIYITCVQFGERKELTLGISQQAQAIYVKISYKVAKNTTRYSYLIHMALLVVLYNKQLMSTPEWEEYIGLFRDYI